jgi:hypothetical protein
MSAWRWWFGSGSCALYSFLQLNRPLHRAPLELLAPISIPVILNNAETAMKLIGVGRIPEESLAKYFRVEMCHV